MNNDDETPIINPDSELTDTAETRPYNLSAVRDVRNICDEREWPITADIISMCYRCGIPSITPRSYLELFTRVQLAYYANRIYHSASRDGRMFRTRKLTLVDIHRRIGIVTAANNLSRNKYLAEINDYMLATVARASSDALLLMHVNGVVDLVNDTTPVSSGDRSSTGAKPNESWLYAQSRLATGKVATDTLKKIPGRLEKILKCRASSSISLAHLRRKRAVQK